MAKEQRSNKWTFIFYQESAPEDYLAVLDDIKVPYVLSPWHDLDIDRKTGELKKSHKHGAFFFDSLKSYSQVSELITTKLNGPSHVEVVMSPTGLYNYFTHAENDDKTQYNIEDIESGCGFDLDKFIVDNSTDDFLNDVIDVIEDNDFTEFEELVWYAREYDTELLKLIFNKTFFFSKFLDSRRHSPKRRERLAETYLNEVNDNERITTIKN